MVSRYQTLKCLLPLLILAANGQTFAFAKPIPQTILQQQLGIVINLMVELNEIYEFDNVIVYRNPSSHYDGPSEVGLLKLSESIELIYRSIGNIITGHIFSPKIYRPLMVFAVRYSWSDANQSIPNLGSILRNDNLAVVLLKDIYNFELKEFVAVSLGASLKTKIVFVLLGHELTDVSAFVRLRQLRRFFRWCWSKNLLNVVLLFQRHHHREEEGLNTLKMEVYTYTPFPQPIEIIQLTDQHPREFFQDRITDLKGYTFRTPVLKDKPRVFKVSWAHSSICFTGLISDIFFFFSAFRS